MEYKIYPPPPKEWISLQNSGRNVWLSNWCFRQSIVHIIHFKFTCSTCALFSGLSTLNDNLLDLPCKFSLLLHQNVSNWYVYTLTWRSHSCSKVCRSWWSRCSSRPGVAGTRRRWGSRCATLGRARRSIDSRPRLVSCSRSRAWVRGEGETAHLSLYIYKVCVCIYKRMLQCNYGI